MKRIRPVVLAVAAWATGAATAIGVGLLALSSVGTSAFTGPPDPLAHPSASPPVATSAAVSPTASATTSVSTADRELFSTGGSVLARCVNGDAYLVAWSPAQGYHTDHVNRGPAPTASVEFEGQGREAQLTVTCVDGVPQAGRGD